jgi:hypothetical protein
LVPPQVKVTSWKLIAPANLGRNPPEAASISSGRFSTAPTSPTAALTSSYSCTSRARPTSGCTTRPLSIMKAKKLPTM